MDRIICFPDCLKVLRFCFFFLSFLYAFSSIVLAFLGDDERPNFNNVFTSKIYKQDQILDNNPELTKSKYDEMLLDNLYKEKELFLREGSLHYLKDRCNLLERHIYFLTLRVQLDNQLLALNQTSEKLQDILKSVGTAMTLDGTRAPMVITHTVAGIIGISTTLTTLYEKEKFNEYCPLPEVMSICREMQTLESKIEQRLNALKHEPIKNLEELYVKRKRFLPSKRQTILEDILLKARSVDFITTQMTTFRVRSTLALPLKPKTLIKGKNINELREEKLKKFNENSFFKNFNNTIKEDLETKLIQIINASLAPKETNVNLKKCFYFQGNPSCGKTTLAAKFAEFLELPYLRKSVTDSSLLEEQKLYGGTWFFSTEASLGLLAQTLLSGFQKGGRSYSNSVLILDDFDRILDSPTSSAFRFLLNLLDPDTKTFFSPFFDEDIDISRLIIIITGNGTLSEKSTINKSPPGSYEEAPNDDFSALRTRLQLVHLPDFTQEQERTILTSFLNEDLLPHCQIPDFYKAKYYRNKNKITLTIKSEENKKYGLTSMLEYTIPLSEATRKISLREKKEILESELVKFQRKQYVDIKSLYEKEMEKEPTLDSLQNFAVWGHPEAAFNLGKILLKSNPEAAKLWHTRALKNGYTENNLEESPIIKKLQTTANPANSRDNRTTSYFRKKQSNFDSIRPLANIDSDVCKDARALERIRELILLLVRPNEPLLQRLEGLTELLGEDPRFFHRSISGKITSLWETKSRWLSRWPSVPEHSHNLEAIKNRMKRFSPKPHKQTLLEFHLGLVQDLTDSLLGFSELKDVTDQEFYERIITDRVKKTNIIFLSKHLKKLQDELKSLYTDQGLGIPAISAKNRLHRVGTSVKDFEEWVNDGDNSKWIELLEKYNLENINPIVYKYAQSLEAIYKLTFLLKSNERETRMNAFTELLGKAGKIENLWKTNTITWRSYEETEANLGAFANRLKRFKNLGKAPTIVKFHINITKKLTEILASFDTNGIDITDHIEHHIVALCEHMKIISNLKDKDNCEGEKLEENIQPIFLEYCKWFKQENSNLLLGRYSMCVNGNDKKGVKDKKSIEMEVFSSGDGKKVDAISKKDSKYSHFSDEDLPSTENFHMENLKLYHTDSDDEIPSDTSTVLESVVDLLSEKDDLADYNYNDLHIIERPNIEGLHIRNHPLNLRGELQEAYTIDGKRFRRQNVAGTAMRCFFNSMGLEADIEIGKLKSKQNDPIVRYIIANEIISASADSHQLPRQVKEAINYTSYQIKRSDLNEREEQRSTFIAHNPNQDLPVELQTTGQDKIILEELRERALSPNSFHSFLDHHIGGEQMMITFHDVQGEEGDNPNANYTSVDAIAYINNLGIKIYRLNGDQLLHLTHQFIPEEATEVVYIYHEGNHERGHFQALIPELGE